MNNQMFFYPLYQQDEQDLSLDRGNEVLFTPEETLMYGNAFKNEYKSYKSFNPGRVELKNDKLLTVMELMDIVHDLRLYLDIFPNDELMHKKFAMYCHKYHEAQKQIRVNDDNPYPDTCDMNKKTNYVFTPSPWIR